MYWTWCIVVLIIEIISLIYYCWEPANRIQNYKKVWMNYKYRDWLYESWELNK